MSSSWDCILLAPTQPDREHRGTDRGGEDQLGEIAEHFVCSIVFEGTMFKKEFGFEHIQREHREGTALLGGWAYELGSVSADPVFANSPRGIRIRPSGQ
jgi:hypothetical protein